MWQRECRLPAFNGSAVTACPSNDTPSSSSSSSQTHWIWICVFVRLPLRWAAHTVFSIQDTILDYQPTFYKYFPFNDSHSYLIRAVCEMSKYKADEFAQHSESITTHQCNEGILSIRLGLIIQTLLTCWLKQRKAAQKYFCMNYI